MTSKLEEPLIGGKSVQQMREITKSKAAATVPSPQEVPGDISGRPCVLESGDYANISTWGKIIFQAQDYRCVTLVANLAEF